MRRANVNPLTSRPRFERAAVWALLLLAAWLVPATASAQVVCYLDTDADGYGRDGNTTTVPSLPCPTGYAAQAGDCNDSNASIRPDAVEIVADQVDQNCDGREICWRDDDRDDFGSALGATVFSFDVDCRDAGESIQPTDCDDTNSSVFPGAPEICDGQDNDCNGIPDDGIIPPPCALQQGVCGGSVQVCGGAAGFLGCGASEYGPNYETSEATCDSLDNDCDGVIDEGVCTAPSVPSMNGWGHLVMALFLLGFAIPSLVERRPLDVESD